MATRRQRQAARANLRKARGTGARRQAGNGRFRSGRHGRAGRASRR